MMKNMDVQKLWRPIGLLFTVLLLVSNIALAADKGRNLAINQVNNAVSEQRIALVIGNSAYINSPLKNPVNDAKDVAKKLRGLGFDVIERNNLQTRQIGATLREFRSKLVPGSVALVFYAGHGLQIKGDNYLPAVDAEINSEEDVPNQSLAVKQIMDVLDESKTRLNLVFLDACRNNPYVRSFRSSDKGLARVNAPSGTLISYATRPGSIAADGSGRNGLYTSKLLAQMNSTVQIEQALKRVVTEVKAASQGKQEPWMEGSIEGDFCFAGCAVDGGTQVASLTPAPVAQNIPVTDDAEGILWQAAESSGIEEDVRIYLRQYPNGKYVALANARIQRFADDAVQAMLQKEQDVWQAAGKTNTEAVYQEYLKTYPAGRFVALVSGRLDKLKADYLKAIAEMKPGEVFRDCPDCPELVILAAGSFDMGSSKGGDEAPVHRVTIAKPFAMGKTEVTQGQWKAIMGNNPSEYKNCGDNCPVEKVNWNDAQEFIQKLNSKTRKQYRLPSESEWEYAARAGTTTAYPWGDQASHEYANYGKNICCAGHVQGRDQWGITSPAGSFPANAFGLYDMIGNVWEWTEDSYHANYNGAPVDGSAWTGDGAKRVVRGGSWDSIPYDSRSAYRGGDASAYRGIYFGFRVARTLP